MNTRLLLPLLLLLSTLTSACPDPKEVGAVPYDQVKGARERVHKAEVKMEQKADVAAEQVKE